MTKELVLSCLDSKASHCPHNKNHIKDKGKGFKSLFIHTFYIIHILDIDMAKMYFVVIIMAMGLTLLTQLTLFFSLLEITLSKLGYLIYPVTFRGGKGSC